MRYDESSLPDLYASAVRAFPVTTKRQHATDPVRIVEMSWTPFLGVKTLFIRAVAESASREYRPIVVFKNVIYHDEPAQGLISLRADDGRNYYFEDLADNDVLLRCDCKDFHWRFNYYNHLDKSLQGRVRSPYRAVEGSNRPEANPLELPGMCKHIMKTMYALRDITR